MSDRQRLSLLAAILITAVSVPASSAQTADVMTPLPPVAVLAAVDFEQVTPDASCLARCATARDRETAGANAMLRDRRYYSNFDSNCWTLTGGPNCAATRQTCREACAPKYDNACMNACEAPFQSCCAANDRTRAARDYDACVVQCPIAKPAAPAEPVKPAPAGDLGKGATINKKAEWAGMLNALTAMLTALGPQVEELDLDRFNNLRRALVFAQVRATLAQNGRKYAVVAGGDGRLWIVLANGEQALVSGHLGALIRSNGRRAGATPTINMMGGSTARTDLAMATGLSVAELDGMMDEVRDAATSGLPAGDVLYFKGTATSASSATGETVASSEHGSIRGTINGGGEFI